MATGIPVIVLLVVSLLSLLTTVARCEEDWTDLNEYDKDKDRLFFDHEESEVGPFIEL